MTYIEITFTDGNTKVIYAKEAYLMRGEGLFYIETDYEIYHINQNEVRIIKYMEVQNGN